MMSPTLSAPVSTSRCAKLWRGLGQKAQTPRARDDGVYRGGLHVSIRTHLQRLFSLPVAARDTYHIRIASLAAEFGCAAVQGPARTDYSRAIDTRDNGLPIDYGL